MVPGKNNRTSSEFVITRVFNAPRDLVFDVWTNPEHLKNWLAPGGMKIHYKTCDIRPGGMAHYSMDGPGPKIWGKAVYEEIKKPTRLVYIQCFSDENGGVGTHPMAPTFPRQMRTTVLFEAEGNKTKITLTWVAVDATDEEIQTFETAKPGMSQGWGGSFAQLDAYLNQL
jgi:uncharacterized protein YndB with AHSA1/START domain